MKLLTPISEPDKKFSCASILRADASTGFTIKAIASSSSSANISKPVTKSATVPPNTTPVFCVPVLAAANKSLSTLAAIDKASCKLASFQ